MKILVKNMILLLIMLGAQPTIFTAIEIMPEANLIAAEPSILSDDTLVVDNTQYDAILLVWNSDKLEIYHALPDPLLVKEVQESLTTLDPKDFTQYISNKDIVWQASKIQGEECYFKNIPYLIVNAEQCISMYNSVIEASEIIFKGNKLDLECLLLPHDCTIHFESPDQSSLISKITLTMQDNPDYEIPRLLVVTDTDFQDNGIMLCLGVKQLEIKMSPAFFQQCVERLIGSSCI